MNVRTYALAPFSVIIIGLIARIARRLHNSRVLHSRMLPPLPLRPIVDSLLLL